MSQLATIPSPATTIKSTRDQDVFQGSNYYWKLEKLQRAIARKQQLTRILKGFNLFLIAACALTFLVMVFETKPLSASKFQPEVQIREFPEIKDASVKVARAVMPLQHYTQPVLERNIFLSKEEQMKNTEEVQSNVLAEIKNQIRIIGIVLDTQPQVIIERIKSGETEFVSKGQQIEGAVVSEILEDKVILTYQNIQLELAR
ncbi:MAG TPA: hypothetical protein VI749_03475 [Candidatus Omnitrophota bacterium]|nr:hypothetical protein [Candidatus Omnitrophota bacterium]